MRHISRVPFAARSSNHLPPSLPHNNKPPKEENYQGSFPLCTKHKPIQTPQRRYGTTYTMMSQAQPPVEHLLALGRLLCSRHAGLMPLRSELSSQSHRLQHRGNARSTAKAHTRKQLVLRCFARLPRLSLRSPLSRKTTHSCRSCCGTLVWMATLTKRSFRAHAASIYIHSRGPGRNEITYEISEQRILSLRRRGRGRGPRNLPNYTMSADKDGGSSPKEQRCSPLTRLVVVSHCQCAPY